MKRHLIIGNGGAAFNAILAIRRLGPEDKISVVSPENCPAYSPMLTPYYISGSIPYSSMFLCKSSFYRKHHVKTILGRAVVAVEPERQRVYLDDGRKLNYDELLIATGSSPNPPTIPGMDLGLTLWTTQEARRLKAAMHRASSVAVVGAGLIGLQIADMALKMEKKVALIEIKDRVLPRVMDKEGAALVAERLLAKGVNLHLGEQVEEVIREKGNRVLTLGSKGKLEAGMVIFATGVYPNRAFLAGSGVKMDNGIVVDEYGQTNKEHIFAAGDVSQYVNPVSGRSEINATWTNAIHSGWAAGCNMAGVAFEQRRKIRVNALSPAGLPVVSLGQVEPETGQDEVVVQRNDGCYRKLVFRSNRLIGAVLIGDVEEAGILSRTIEGEGLLPTLKADMAKRSAFHSLCRSSALTRYLL